MKCPYCGKSNIDGEDTCVSCGGDLSSIDVTIEPQSELERALLEDPISSIPPAKAIQFSPDNSIFEAACEMNKNKIGCVLVMVNKQLKGIVSERDILFKALQTVDQDPSKITLGSIMTEEPESLNEGDSIAYALNRMSAGGFRHIPITEDTKVVGLISVTNLLNYITKRLPE
jgi:CBS domain-containing protein